jgi:hypothetical protein
LLSRRNLGDERPDMRNGERRRRKPHRQQRPLNGRAALVEDDRPARANAPSDT